MDHDRYASVWDAIEDDPAQAENLELRSHPAHPDRRQIGTLSTLTNPRPSGFLPLVSRRHPAEESGVASPFRRRRRNRPGNAQANGPLGDDALESGLGASRLGPPTG